MTRDDLERRIDDLAASPEPDPTVAADAVAELLEALEQGTVRAACPSGDTWTALPWVKRGILLGFRIGQVVEMPAAGPMFFRDKNLFPVRDPAGLADVRVVPGGTSIRRGCHIGAGTVLMPPAYVNVGAYIGAGTMVDSHALVGSCAQIGTGVHLSAGAQIGGVLEPPGALPVVVEDNAFVGALSGLFEGVRVRRGAVIGAGVILTASTPVYDLTREEQLGGRTDTVLEIPENAVVVPGSRPLGSEWARAQGLAAGAALIVKHRDAGTDARAALEDALR